MAKVAVYQVFAVILSIATENLIHWHPQEGHPCTKYSFLGLQKRQVPKWSIKNDKLQGVQLSHFC